MTDIWLIFDNSGKFLFKTSNFVNTQNIPEKYNVTYIIKNPPGYNPLEEQHISYNIETNTVEFTEFTLETLEIFDTSNAAEQNITDISTLLFEIEENKQKIDTLTATILLLTTRTNELEINLNDIPGTIENGETILSLSTKINTVELTLNNLSQSFDNIFPL